MDRTPTLQPCGTRAAYRRHRKAGEEPCEPCRAALQEAKRRWREEGVTPRPPLQPCGTIAAYRRHLHHGEAPCDACTEVHRQENRRLRAAAGIPPQAPPQPCGTVAAYRRHLAAREEPCEPCRSAIADLSQKRKARKRSNGHEPYDRREVFEWDSWRCQMCNQKVGGRLKATIDHIVPISLGGPDIRANVQTACGPCNSAKRDRAANDQMRLFGAVDGAGHLNREEARDADHQ